LPPLLASIWRTIKKEAAPFCFAAFEIASFTSGWLAKKPLTETVSKGSSLYASAFGSSFTPLKRR